MSYKITQKYYDGSWYEQYADLEFDENTAEIKNRFMMETLEFYTSAFGMVGIGDEDEWVYTRFTFPDGSVKAIKLSGRRIKFEDCPVIFYLVGNGYSFDLVVVKKINGRYEQGSNILSVNQSKFNSYNFTDYASYEEWMKFHRAGMFEKITDIGGGIHIQYITKKYNNDKTYVNDGVRNFVLSIIPIYNFRTNEFYDWGIKTSGTGVTSLFAYDNWSNIRTIRSNYQPDMTHSGGISDIYPTMTANEMMYNTIATQDMYYTVGSCVHSPVFPSGISTPTFSSNYKTKYLVYDEKNERVLNYVNLATIGYVFYEE